LALLKRISQGRLAEIAGPIATDIDHALRILDFGRSVPEIQMRLPPSTREFLDSFVAGLNYHQEHTSREPPEFGLLGMSREPWTVEDILRMSRVAGTDINWLVYFNLLSIADPQEREAAWRATLSLGSASATSFERDDRIEALNTLLSSTARSGSNAFAISPSRSSSGAAVLASDPHLGLRLPNFWLLVGIKSPSYHAVGMMIPGVPIMGLGRNECLAWGGTNMRANSSELYDVSELSRAEIDTRVATIRQRLWFPSERTIRDTSYGPIITDATFFHDKHLPEIALRWIGHEPTDEISAFLNATQACSPGEFRSAFKTFGVSGQNMLFATRQGDIGQVLAATLPRRGSYPPPWPIRKTSDLTVQWTERDTALSLPWILNPREGFIASSNNKPTHEGPPVGFLFSSNDRVQRLQSLISLGGRLSLEDIKRIQQDVISVPAKDLAAFFGARASLLINRSDYLAAIQELQSWDGSYSARSTGALTFELFLEALIDDLSARHAFPEYVNSFDQWGVITGFLKQAFERLPPETQRQALTTALAKAEDGRAHYQTWGAFHRLSVGHPLSGVPILGRFFVEGDYPAPGSRETVLKSSHRLQAKRHNASFGSQSRFIADLSNPNENYFILLGGEDGWLGSVTYTDQVPAFLRGEYIKLPLEMSEVKRIFTHQTTLAPLR
jgi:penicillin amidase